MASNVEAQPCQGAAFRVFFGDPTVNPNVGELLYVSNFNGECMIPSLVIDFIESPMLNLPQGIGARRDTRISVNFLLSDRVFQREANEISIMEQETRRTSFIRGEATEVNFHLGQNGRLTVKYRMPSLRLG